MVRVQQMHGWGAPDARVEPASWSQKLTLAGVTSFRKPQSPAMGSDLTKPNICVPIRRLRGKTRDGGHGAKPEKT